LTNLQETDITTIIQWRRHNPRHTGRDRSEQVVAIRRNGWSRSSECADIIELINEPPPPVVIELTNIDERRLTNENGSMIFGEQFDNYLDLANEPSVSLAASFRIQNVMPGDVVAVHGTGANFRAGGVKGSKV
jgi:hypothetical protein